MPAEPRTLAALGRAFRNGTTTSEAVTDACLAAIATKDGGPSGINAFITVLADDARTQARAADAALAAGDDRGPLHGVPLSLKDLLDVAGAPTTAASRVRAGHVATSDATAVARLRAAGAVFVGKTNLHEFAFGTTNEDSAYGPVRHPLDASRSPGGSSGGSAASVLAGMAVASIGTDTGGSIRIPSAACGLVGLKPGLGEVPTTGVVPLSTTMDHVGPLCRSVEDAALLYGVLRGARLEPPTERRPDLLRLGVPRAYFCARLDPDVAAAFDAACERLRESGVTIDDVTIPHATDIAPIYLHIVLAEGARYHAATLESRPGDYTPAVRVRLEMGRYVLAEDYARALAGRAVLQAEVDAALAGRDGLLLPTLPVPATPLGADTVRMGDTDEPVRAATLRLTQLFNLTGHPAITIPCGRTPHGLPVGAQLAGAAGRTGALLGVARAVEPVLSA
jgi:aspartyl-tRNA(Asn)/glutamyl-tRNA(Gln) amidotransferase subunit A